MASPMLPIPPTSVGRCYRIIVNGDTRSTIPKDLSYQQFIDTLVHLWGPDKGFDIEVTPGVPIYVFYGDIQTPKQLPISNAATYKGYHQAIQKKAVRRLGGAIAITMSLHHASDKDVQIPSSPPRPVISTQAQSRLESDSTQVTTSQPRKRRR